MPDPCRHPEFTAQVNVTRLLETDSQVQPPPDRGTTVQVTYAVEAL